jgi:multidrug efflux pump subunit AcrB
VLLILGSVSLAYFQLVVLKMLPFDNKSEFQVILDMPVGTPVEETARVLHEIGAELATGEDVVDYQAYAGTASPINFNGLVRQYYLRARRKRAISRSIWPTSSSVRAEPRNRWRRARAHRGHRQEERRRRQGGRSAARAAGDVAHRCRNLRPGLQGPDQRRQAGARRFRADADIVAVDDYIDADARKFVLHVLQSKAALLGVAQSDIVEVVGMGLAGRM